MRFFFSTNAPLRRCDVVYRLLVANASEIYELELMSVRNDVGLDLDTFNRLNAPSLAYLIEQCQSLKALKLEIITLDEDHCGVLGACLRPGLEIELQYCKLTSAGINALVEL